MYTIVCIWLDPSPPTLCAHAMWMTPYLGDLFFSVIADYEEHWDHTDSAELSSLKTETDTGKTFDNLYEPY